MAKLHMVQNSPVYDFTKFHKGTKLSRFTNWDNSLMEQNSPIWIIVFFHTGTKLSHMAKMAKTTHGTKLSRLEFYQISHREKTLPFGQSGPITYGTKLSCVIFQIFKEGQNSPVSQKWANEAW